MGFLQRSAERMLWRMIERRSSLENPQTPLSFPAEWLLDIFNGGRTDSGIRISEMTALQTDAVLACVSIISKGIASLPLHVYERQIRDGRMAKLVAPDHPLYDLLRAAPNEEMTSHTFRGVLMVHVLLWGNAYVEMQRNNAAQVVALWPRNPARTRPVRLTHDATIEGTRFPRGTLVYHTSETLGDEISGQDDSQNRMAPERLILAEDMLHFPGLSLDGRLGQSTVYLSRQIIGLALATEKFGAKFFGNGAVPRGILEIPGVLEPKALENLRRSWQEAHGGENAHKTAILEQGTKYTPIGFNLEQSQFLNTRKYQRSAIASIFNVPPHMIGEGENSKSSVEQTSIEFLHYCIGPWLDLLEQEFKRKMFPSFSKDKKFFAKFDTHQLLYPNSDSRSKFYNAGKNWGWLSTNDIHELEDMNPVEDGSGDLYWMPVNMQDAANPLTAPHIGGLQNGYDTGQQPEQPMGGEPQNRAINVANPTAEVTVGPWTVSLYEDDTTWHVLIFGNGKIAHVYHGPDKSQAKSVYAKYKGMDEQGIDTVMKEHLSGDKEALVNKARSLTSLVTRYTRIYYSMFKDATGRVQNRREVDEAIFRRCFEPALVSIVESLSAEMADNDATAIPASEFSEQLQAYMEGMRCNLQGLAPELSETYASREVRRAAETLARLVEKRYHSIRDPKDGKFHDGKKPFFIGRHATTQDDIDGLWSGWDTVPLTDQGIAEAKDSAQKLKGLGIKRIVSSDLVRAKQTAGIYADILGVPMTTDWRLNALNIGIFSKMKEKGNEDRLKLYIDNPDVQIPDGEKVNDSIARINAAMNEARGQNELSGPILALTHSSGIATYLSGMKDLERASALLSPAGVVRLDGKKITVITGKLGSGDAA